MFFIARKYLHIQSKIETFRGIIHLLTLLLHSSQSDLLGPRQVSPPFCGLRARKKYKEMNGELNFRLWKKADI